MTYTWDLGSHFVSVTAVCSDRERFGTVIGAVDELARGIRVVDDLTVGESATVLRIDEHRSPRGCACPARRSDVTFRVPVQMWIPDHENVVKTLDYKNVVRYPDYEFVVKGALMAYRGRVPNAESLGLMLQQGRLARGLSQRALAAELGLTQRWVSEMEAGKPGKLTERLFTMLDATGVRLYAELDPPIASDDDA